MKNEDYKYNELGLPEISQQKQEAQPKKEQMVVGVVVVVDEEERIFLGAMGVGLDDAQSIRDERAAQEQFAFESAGFNFGYNQP